MKKLILILAIIVFIAYSGFVGSAKQTLKENTIYEDGQITFAGHGAVENAPAKTLLAADKESSSKVSSSIFGFSSETYISATSSSAKNSKAPVTNVALVARIDSITPNPAHIGSSVTFKGSGTATSGKIKAYLWKVDGTTVSTKASFSISTSNLAVGDHTITFSVQNNRGAWSDEVTRTLIIEPANIAPSVTTVSISHNSATFGTEIDFIGDGTDEDGKIVAYRWTIDGNMVSTVARFTKSDLAVGEHTITFSVKDDDGAWSNEARATLVITEPPKLVATIKSITPNPATKGELVYFEGTGTDTYGAIVKYSWTIDGNIVNENPSFSISTSDFDPGTHIVKFRVQDVAGAWSVETEESTATLTITETPVGVPSKATVILTFDDGFKSDYDIVYPMLQERNMRASHYIIPSMVGADSTRMSWNDIKTMSDAGFDIECHSYYHNDLTAMSSTKIKDEMLKVNTAFAANGVPAPRHTAYPFGVCNDNVISVISQYRDTGRVVTWQNNAYYPLESLKNPYELPCYPTDYGGTINEIKKAQSGNYVLILGFHKISESRSSTYEMSISEFRSILDYIESNNIRTQTISEYYNETFKA